MDNKIKVIVNNEEVNTDLVSSFEIENNKFVLLTKNELDQNGNVKLLASQILDGKLSRIDDENWVKVKNVMRSIISSSAGDYNYINPSESNTFEAEGNYSRTIAVQENARQTLISDYDSNKPVASVNEIVKEASNEEENVGIYPTENVSVPIGSEVAEGIAETPQEETTQNVDVEDAFNVELPKETDINEKPSIESEEKVVEESTQEEINDDKKENTFNVDEAVEMPKEEIKEEPTFDQEFEKVDQSQSLEIDAIPLEIRKRMVEDIMVVVNKYIGEIILNQNKSEIKSMLDNIQTQISKISR